jgi:hypothetical protein
MANLRGSSCVTSEVHPAYQQATEPLSLVIKGRDLGLTTHSHVVLRIKNEWSHYSTPP